MSLKFSLNPTANFPAHPRTNIEFPLGFDDSCGLTTSVDLGERRSLRMVSQVAGVPILQWRPYGSMMIHVASNSNSLEFHAELCAIPHAFYGWRWAFFLGRSSKATLRWSQQLSACPDCAVQGHLVCLLCTSWNFPGYWWFSTSPSEISELGWFPNWLLVLSSSAEKPCFHFWKTVTRRPKVPYWLKIVSGAEQRPGSWHIPNSWWINPRFADSHDSHM